MKAYLRDHGIFVGGGRLWGEPGRPGQEGWWMVRGRVGPQSQALCKADPRQGTGRQLAQILHHGWTCSMYSDQPRTWKRLRATANAPLSFGTDGVERLGADQDRPGDLNQTGRRGPSDPTFSGPGNAVED